MGYDLNAENRSKSQSTAVYKLGMDQGFRRTWNFKLLSRWKWVWNRSGYLPPGPTQITPKNKKNYVEDDIKRIVDIEWRPLN